MLTREYTTHSQPLNSDQLAMRRRNTLSIFSVNNMFKEGFSQNSEQFSSMSQSKTGEVV